MDTLTPAPVLPSLSVSQAIEATPWLKEALRSLKKEGFVPSTDPHRLLGQSAGRFLAPRWLWLLQTDVFHRRVFSWNRIRYWDHPYARMLLDTRPQHWTPLCQRAAKDFQERLGPVLSGLDVNQDVFHEGVSEALHAFARPALRTSDAKPQAALERWLNQSLAASRAAWVEARPVELVAVPA